MAARCNGSTSRIFGHRLSKIYTRTGDDGMTGLATGQRIKKTDPRVGAFGDVDEINSAIGLVLSEPITDDQLRTSLLRIQHELFDLGAELSLPSYHGVHDEQILQIESDLDALNAGMPPLKEFILPGGNKAAAACHLARSICRRAERTAWALADESEVSSVLLQYLNRLSDFLFVAARSLARQNGGTETMWKKLR